MTDTVLLIERIDGRGRVLQRERFVLDPARPGVTIGRGVEADVVLDDPYVAPVHVRVTAGADGRFGVDDLGSANGMRIGGERRRGSGGFVSAGDTLQVGRTTLRLRGKGESLAPELVDQATSGFGLARPTLLAIGSVAAIFLSMAYSTWSDAPRDMADSFVRSLFMALPLTAGWVGMWALLTRIMQGEWRWLRHIGIVGLVWIALEIVDSLLDVSWYAFSLPRWSWRDKLLMIAAFAVALRLHLHYAAHLTARQLTAVVAIVPVLLVATTYWMVDRSNQRNVNFIDAGLQIYPPAFRLSSAGPVPPYFDRVKLLRAAADGRRHAVIGEDEDREP